MRNLHDDANTLPHHETFEHDMNTTEGPVNSASAPDNIRPGTSVATISIPQKADKMSIGFVIDTEIEAAEPIRAPVQHTAFHSQQQNSNRAVVKTTLHGNYDIHTKSCPSRPSQNTSARPIYDPQPASDYPKRRKHISSRLKYSEDQDFTIAYWHFVKDMDWDQIEHEFKRLFWHRTKDALTCHCSKIRRKWDLAKAKGIPTNREGNKSKILHRALDFPMEFLMNIGFVHWKERLELCKAAGRSM
jgi:hypothetical protein